VTPEEFFPLAVKAANEARHVFPGYSACEAAEESGWGESELAKRFNNLFGEKRPRGSGYETVSLPTHEVVHGKTVTVTALWPVFPDWKTSFEERMHRLTALASVYPEYALALSATDGEDFVREVSKRWSTDPHRADKVLAIYYRHKDLLEKDKTL
jgi:flagellum-specific peptidoglycan hydrolase FlgJ